MQDAPRPLFRLEAMQRYSQQQEAILPRFIAPHTFTCLWLLLGLLGSASIACWLARIPVYASGRAIVVDAQKTKTGGDGLQLVAFLPPEDYSRLQVGQNLIFQVSPTGDRQNRPIVVTPEIISPEAARRRFGLAAEFVSQPSTVAIASFASKPSNLPVAAYIGSTYPVNVEIGSQRAISLLPLFGQFFGDKR